MKISLLLSLASTVVARFNYLDITSCNKTQRDVLLPCPRNCVGVLPYPKTVSSRDVLNSGFLTCLFRKSVAKCQAKSIALRDALVICTRRSNCRLISREKFMEAVIATMKRMNKNKCVEIPKRARIVIDHIYNAACETDASIDALITFTSIALHNMHIFFRFTIADVSNISIGETCRGLLQFKTYNNYQKLNSVSRADYILCPYLLDKFSAESILDEFRAYIRFYFDCEESTRVSKFIASIHRLAPNESPYITEEAAILISRGCYKPKNLCEKRVLQRFNIYNILSLYVFGTEITSVRIIEN